MEDSIYIHPDAKGRGIGTLLFERLLELLKKQGFRICYSLIEEDNAPSLRMHEKYGFVKEGVKRRAAISCGQYKDEVIMARIKDFG